ncbi:MAG: RNA polymerase-binding protein DksA [Bacteriovoracia bacterium]
MNKQKTDFFKKLLSNQLSLLQKEMNQTRNQISHDEEVYADWTDVASVETDKTLRLKIKDRERMLMVKIEDALKRISEGTFGECERCGEEISEQRLKARPVTTLCIDCKSELESAEHRYQYT